jgi:hypothetical protein
MQGSSSGFRNVASLQKGEEVNEASIVGEGGGGSRVLLLQLEEGKVTEKVSVISKRRVCGSAIQ